MEPSTKINTDFQGLIEFLTDYRVAYTFALGLFILLFLTCTLPNISNDPLSDNNADYPYKSCAVQHDAILVLSTEHRQVHTYKTQICDLWDSTSTGK